VKYSEAVTDSDCAIAQALAVLGDWWTLLILREVTGGRIRFNQLADELGVSRKVLTQRLHDLVVNGVLERRQYSERPARFEYQLTDNGRGLLPVLIALQDWGARFVLGDGTLSATSAESSTEARRIRSLVGRRIPEMTLVAAQGRALDPVASSEWTVLYCFAAARGPGGGTYPPGWDTIPGATGCTLESKTFRDQLPEFHQRGVAIHGASTQRPDELADFATSQRLGFPLLSDQYLQLSSALRLPTFRADGVDRMKRLTLIVDDRRIIRSVIYPIADPAASVSEALHRLDELRQLAA
jgi:DNA-binding HxlR family transcriptional regulator/peroxiredoxin